MFYYLLAFALSIGFYFICLKTERNRVISNMFWLLAVITPCTLAALRGLNVGTDVLIYQRNAFMQAERFLNFFDYLDYKSSGEILYYLIAWISARFFNIQTMFFLNELLVILPLFLAFRVCEFKKSEQLLAVIIYDFVLYNLTLNMARQTISLSFCVLAYGLLAFRNKKISSIAIILVASLFHESALLFLAVIGIGNFIKTKFFNRHKAIILPGILILLALMTANFSSLVNKLGNVFIDTDSNIQKYTTYAHNYEGAGFLKIDFIYSVTLLVLALLSSKNGQKKEGDDNSVSLRIFGICCVPGWFVNMIIQYSYRIFLYFEYPFLFLEVPRIPSRFKSGKNRLLIFTTIAVLSIGYWFTTYIVKKSSETYPYTFYWQQ